MCYSRKGSERGLLRITLITRCFILYPPGRSTKLWVRTLSLLAANLDYLRRNGRTGLRTTDGLVWDWSTPRAGLICGDLVVIKIGIHSGCGARRDPMRELVRKI